MSKNSENTERWVRATLNQFLHEINIANTFAALPHGQSALEGFAAECELALRHGAAPLKMLPDWQREEWAAAAAKICQSFFARVELRRSDLVRAREEPTA